MPAIQESTSSKLIAKLREISRGAVSPFGFGRAAAQQVPSLLILVSLPCNDAELARAAVAAGADGLVCHIFNPGDPAKDKQLDKDKAKDDVAGDHAKDANGAAGSTTGSTKAELVGNSEEASLGKSPNRPADKSSEEPAKTPSEKPTEPEKPTTKFGGLAEEQPAIEAVIKSASGKPVGIAIGTSGEASTADLEAIARLGVDFVFIHPHRAPIALLKMEALGYIARLDREYSSGPLRGLNDLGIDAVAIAVTRPDDSITPLTIHDLASYRQAIDPVRRPVLIDVGEALQPADLKAFHEIGAEAIVLTPELLGDTAESLGAKVAEYRAAVAKLGPSVGRGRAQEGRRVTLPKVSAPAEAEEDDDDDGDAPEHGGE